MSDIITLIKTFLNENKYELEYHNLELQLLSHPEFPNFKSISDTFDYFKIENIVASVPPDQLEELPEIFLSIVRLGDSDVIVKIKKKKFEIIVYGKAGKFIFSYHEFIKIWSGDIIAVEKNIIIKSTKRFITFFPLAFAVFLLLLVLGIQFHRFNFSSLIILIVTLLGIAISFLLIMEDVGYKNTIASKVCSMTNSNGSCKNVISSKNSKLFGVFSLTDLAASFYIAQFITINTLGINFGFIYILSVLSIPILGYSIFIQLRIIKNWCILCIGIIVICLVQFVFLSISVSVNQLKFDTTYYFKAIFIITLVYSFVYYTTNNIKAKLELKQSQIKFLKFKRNAELFNILLNESREVNINAINSLNKISFGENNALLEISAITNPLCGHCADSFQVYKRLLKKYENRLKINFIFLVPYQYTDNLSTQIASNIVQYYLDGNSGGAWKALTEWFDSRDIQQWKLSKPNLNPDMRVGQLLMMYNSWSKENRINHTPITIIGTKIFPDIYSIDDLEFLMEDILIDKRDNMNLLDNIVATMDTNPSVFK